MNSMKANTDKKKKMLLLSLLKGGTNDKKKEAKESWDSFKKRFRADWQPINVAREAQMKIEDLRMKDRADDYVNKFCLIAMETEYDDMALIKFFKEGLPGLLQDKIMLRSKGAPDTLEDWYKFAIRYDNQYKLAMANKKRRTTTRDAVKPRIVQKEKETMINRILSESDKKDYLAQGKCFRCAKTGHIS
ncbi:hypothetical protein Moror_16740 [Moniliophthora roreri MCA 2997]|uniref:Retrotransposon gag domain-containing protein n=1 Tax=Moniliophthora roreri (strain MCA 2997) TaxID=1381753 RepID=V2WNH7_MONRO|nr:hypothetical protein Moror_16740 [Moniliophthora roreri MCA 2997]